MLSTDRAWINVILDTDNNQSDAHFALYNNDTGTPAEAVVNFSVDESGDSWVNSGDFGIRTNNPLSDFHVKHKSDALSDGILFENSLESTAFRIFINSSGNMLLYASEAEGSGPVGGFSGTTGAYMAMSDARRKTNIKDVEDVSNKIQQLRPVTYHFKGHESANTSYGFLAQEVATVFPEVVSYDEKTDSYLMDYSSFGVIAVAALQQQQSELDALHQKNRALENRLQAMEDEISEIRDLKAQLEQIQRSLER